MAVSHVKNNTKYKALRGSRNGHIKKGDIITKKKGVPGNWSSEYLMLKEVDGKMVGVWMYSSWLDIASKEDIAMAGGLYNIY